MFTYFLTTFRYVVTIPDIDPIGGFSDFYGLELSVDVFEYREGGNHDVVHRLPGSVNYPNLTLRRGLTHQTALLDWFEATRKQAERKEVTISMKGAEGIRSFTFADAFPVRWIGPRGSAAGTDVAIEELEIAHGGLRPV